MPISDYFYNLFMSPGLYLTLALVAGIFLGIFLTRANLSAARTIMDMVNASASLRDMAGRLASAHESVESLRSEMGNLTAALDRVDHNQTAMVVQLVRVGLLDSSKVRPSPDQGLEPRTSASKPAEHI